MQERFKYSGANMGRTEKTVFISYRRTNLPWALAVYQNLTHRGYDVFFDYESINSGDFEKIIIGNIRARAHFIVILTPSALERCVNADDWLRREIETALDEKRNIVPLFLEGFNFGSPSIAQYLTGKMAVLKSYNGLNVPVDYFEAAMEKLCQRFLNVSLDAVLHPLSSAAEQAVKVQKAAVNKALMSKETATDRVVKVPKTTSNKVVKNSKVAVSDESKAKKEVLTASEWFKKGNKAFKKNVKIDCYTKAIYLKPDYAEAYCKRAIWRQSDSSGAIKDLTEAIRLKPDYAEAYFERGRVHSKKGNLEGAIEDLTEAIRLKPNYAEAYNSRGSVRKAKDDLDGALKDYTEAIRLKPDYLDAYFFRGYAHSLAGDRDGAIQDYTDVLRLKPDYVPAYLFRGRVYDAIGDWDAAIKDYTEALRLWPKYPDLFRDRAVTLEKKKEYTAAIADYQKYLKLGGGERNGDQAQIEESIRDLKKKIK
jgi:tetratricopeptide (TPR) repeat protein